MNEAEKAKKEPDRDMRTVKDCKKRFTDSGPLLFGGFPAVMERIK